MRKVNLTLYSKSIAKVTILGSDTTGSKQVNFY